MATTTYKAFVSSTYEDLKAHRTYVINALGKAGILVDPMEQWTAESDEPKQFSAERIEGCDFCVLLVALRSGFVPPGDVKSITQLEYEAAIKHGMDVLVFLLDVEKPWPRRFDELDESLKEWRKYLQNKHGVSWFGTDPSTVEIAPAVTRWVAKQSQKVTQVGSDWVQLISTLLHLNKHDPDTWTVAARLLPEALAAVEGAYYGRENDPQRAQPSDVSEDIVQSKVMKTLLASTREFLDESRINYEKTCFVIMPFGRKRVGDQEVDFDFIYGEEDPR